MFGTTALCAGGKVFLFPWRDALVVKIPASEERIATDILASRLARLEAAGLMVKTVDDPRSGKQAYHAAGKGEDPIPLVLEMVLWSAEHDPQVAVPAALIARLRKDRAGTIGRSATWAGSRRSSPRPNNVPRHGRIKGGRGGQYAVPGGALPAAVRW
jgi:hypothetical protein